MYLAVKDIWFGCVLLSTGAIPSCSLEAEVFVRLVLMLFFKAFTSLLAEV